MHESEFEGGRSVARVIMITSGKGGVGKTTVCANLGIALASLGKKVCMIDMDLGLKNLDVMMGLENRVFYDLKDAVEGRCPLSRAMIQDKRCENLFLMAACRRISLISSCWIRLPGLSAVSNMRCAAQMKR